MNNAHFTFKTESQKMNYLQIGAYETLKEKTMSKMLLLPMTVLIASEACPKSGQEMFLFQRID